MSPTSSLRLRQKLSHFDPSHAGSPFKTEVAIPTVPSGFRINPLIVITQSPIDNTKATTEWSRSS